MLEGSILGLLYLIIGIFCLFILIGIISIIILLIKKCIARRHRLETNSDFYALNNETI